MVKLSVVMPNYNHSEYLPQALDAILMQSYTPYEFIILDDASTDNSIEILEQYAKTHPFIKLIRNEKNMGVLHNVNRLLELSSGDYIYGAAADDRISQDFFKKSIEMLAKYPNAGLCSTLSYSIDECSTITGLVTKNIVSTKPCYINPGRSRKYLLRYYSWIQGNATMYHRQKLLDVGGFRPELKSYTDGFIAQVLALKYGACFIPEPLVSWRKLSTGYALSQETDYYSKRNIVLQAQNLMMTEYSAYFPKGYIKRWVDNEKYFLLNIQIHTLCINTNKYLDNVLRETGYNFKEDDFVFKYIKILTRLHRRLLKLYFFFRLVAKHGVIFSAYKRIKFLFYKTKRSLTRLK